MAAMRVIGKVFGALLGLGLVGAGVVSVFLIEPDTQPPEEPLVVRPLKTIVVGEPLARPPRKYPGKVRANQEVDLAFQVSGPLIELPVKKGQKVDKDMLLARIDPRDFQNELDAATAEAGKAKAHLERIEKAAKTGAVSGTDLTNAQAASETAEARERIAAKALEDTYLRAKFTGVVANTFAENFENVQAKQAILSLQDVSRVDIEVNLPEERIARAKRPKEGEAPKSRFVATFDYLPGRKFDVEVKEFATEADPATQTYVVTFTMPAPDDVNILPGMTTTVSEIPKAPVAAATAGHAVPADAVPVDGVGQPFVWKVTEGADKALTVHRTDVKVGQMTQDSVLVVEGLTRGDRIAAAGVHLLQEGQQIRLLESKGEGAAK